MIPRRSSRERRREENRVPLSSCDGELWRVATAQYSAGSKSSGRRLPHAEEANEPSLGIIQLEEQGFTVTIPNQSCNVYKLGAADSQS